MLHLEQKCLSTRITITLKSVKNGFHFCRTSQKGTASDCPSLNRQAVKHKQPQVSIFETLFLLSKLSEFILLYRTHFEDSHETSIDYSQK